MKTRVLLLMTLAVTAIQCPAQSTSTPYTWSTIAGVFDVDGIGGYANGNNGSALFSTPTGLAVDRAGNLYVADTCNHVIRKMKAVGTDWVVSLLAGSPGNPGTNDLTGSAAQFAWPMGVAVDAFGNVYVADTYNNTIRQVTPAGVVSTIAGTPANLNTRGTNYADGPGPSALFYQPIGLAVDSALNIYVADGNYCIRKITPVGNTWQVTTLAGDHQWLEKPPGTYQGNDDGAGPNATFGEFDMPESGVAVDGAGNVYVADPGNGTIRKVTPQGVVSTIAGNVAAMYYATSQGNLAWGNKDGLALSGQAASPFVTATSPNAAGIIAQMPNAQFYAPWGLAVDSANNIYVADTENSEIRKVPPQGLTTTLGGAPTFNAFAEPVGFPQDGTGGAARFSEPTGVAVDGDGNVYVAETGVFWNFLSGTTTDGPGIIRKGVAPVVQVVALEVTQVIQNWSNSCPLIQGKDTFVRAHLQLPPGKAGTITVAGALLYGTDSSGNPLPGSPIVSINPPDGSLTVQVYDASVPFVRGYFSGSLNFWLPDKWVSGTITLQLAWSGGLQPTNVLHNSASVKVTFVPAAVPVIKFFAVDWTDGSGTAYNVGPILEDFPLRIESCYPVASVPPSFATLPWASTGPPPFLEVLTNMNQQLHFKWTTAGFNTGVFNQGLYHGVIVPTVAPGNGDVTGIALGIPSSVSSSILESTLPYGPRGRHDASHELAHNLGLNHDVSEATFGDVYTDDGVLHAAGSCDEIGPLNYVYPLFQPVPGKATKKPTLGPMTNGANSLIYGFDSKAYLYTDVEPVVSPYLFFDLMSYCDPVVDNDGKDRWPSAVTYLNLLNGINAAFGPPAAALLGGPRPQGVAVGGNYLFVRGLVDFIAGTAQFLPCVALSMSTAPPGPLAGTNFLLQALDNSGAVLQAIQFGLNPSVVEQGATNLASDFIVPIKDDPSIDTLKLWRNGALLATLTASPHAPTLTLTTPNGGQNFSTGTVPVAWSGNDGDGDLLTYTVQYSTDNGATWDTLVVDWPRQSLGVNSAELAATTRGLMRVIASDGFNTATAQSAATFTIQPHAPVVSIASPRDGAVFMSDQQLVLDARASDMQDGLLGGTNVQWVSDRDGPLGSGAMLTFNAKQLSEGQHTITVTATDSAGLTNSAVTHLLELHYPAPQLSLQFTPATTEFGTLFPAYATLTWPSYYANYVLQSSDNLTAGWAAMTKPLPQVSGYELSVDVGISNAPLFFRLVFQP